MTENICQRCGFERQFHASEPPYEMNGEEEFCSGFSYEPRHQIGCICADCSGAELTSEND